MAPPLIWSCVGGIWVVFRAGNIYVNKALKSTVCWTPKFSNGSGIAFPEYQLRCNGCIGGTILLEGMLSQGRHRCSEAHFQSTGPIPLLPDFDLMASAKAKTLFLGSRKIHVRSLSASMPLGHGTKACGKLSKRPGSKWVDSRSEWVNGLLGF